MRKYITIRGHLSMHDISNTTPKNHTTNPHTQLTHLFKHKQHKRNTPQSIHNSPHTLSTDKIPIVGIYQNRTHTISTTRYIASLCDNLYHPVPVSSSKDEKQLLQSA